MEWDGMGWNGMEWVNLEADLEVKNSNRVYDIKGSFPCV